jgi:hypothetical protein
MVRIRIHMNRLFGFRRAAGENGPFSDFSTVAPINIPTQMPLVSTLERRRRNYSTRSLLINGAGFNHSIGGAVPAASQKSVVDPYLLL